MKRRLFLVAGAASAVGAFSPAVASVPWPIGQSVRLIIIDAVVSSDHQELLQSLSEQIIAANAANFLRSALQAQGTTLAVVTRHEEFSVVAQDFPILTRLYATIRVEIGFLDSEQSKAVGVVSIFLRRAEYGAEWAPGSWRFFQASRITSDVTSAVDLAVSDQVRKSLAGPIIDIGR